MKRRILFRARSPLDYTVVLTRDRWRQIIRFKHPALAGREKRVKQCIEQPVSVRASAKDAEVHLYYTPAPRGHLCVVAGPAGNQEHFVITAYFCKEPKKGNELWKK